MFLEASWKLLIGQLWITVYDTKLTTSPGEFPKHALKCMDCDYIIIKFIMVDIPGYPQGKFKHIHRYSFVSANHMCVVIIILGICMFPLARFLSLTHAAWN